MKKTIYILSSMGILLTSSVLAHSGEDEFGHHMMGGGNMMYGGYGIGFFGWIIPILVVVVLILLIFWLTKQISKK